jgi:hypothetical protein
MSMSIVDEQLLTTEQLAAQLQLAVITLVRWRGQQKGPPYLRIEGTVRYRPIDVANWIHAQQPGEMRKQG